MIGTKLQEKTALGRGLALGREALAGVLRGPASETLAWALGGLLLAALPLLGRPLPLGACLVYCAGLWAPALGALAGAFGGYLLFWGWAAALEPLTLSLCFLAAALILRRTPVSPAPLCGGLTAGVGAVFLLDSGLRLSRLFCLGLGALLAALLPLLRLRALDRREPRAQLAAGALALAGLCAAAPPVGPALALGLCFLLPLARGLPLPGQPGAPQPRPPRSLPAQKGVEKALLTMHRVLAEEDPVLPPICLSEVYDAAAETLCRCCVGFSLCWEQRAQETYEDLCAAGEAIRHRGAAEREDLPQRFTQRCRHTEGFLTAVNQSLDQLLARRREERRRVESRRVAAGQYLALERLLEALTRPQSAAAPCFAPELAVGTACKEGCSVSGDRGATCRDRFGNFYVLLCDGMGSGPAARGESDRAARLLTAFLEAGMEADGALDLVNGFFVLRRDTAFATLDLLKLDLRTGRGTLYKWGAAPSYLRRGPRVEKIGTATPPPGLEPGSDRVPGQYELSLREGETLVMVSDGAYGEETAQRLAELTMGTVRDLASCLITLGEADTRDDRTALVLRLRSLRSA